MNQYGLAAVLLVLVLIFVALTPGLMPLPTAAIFVSEPYQEKVGDYNTIHKANLPLDGGPPVVLVFHKDVNPEKIFMAEFDKRRIDLVGYMGYSGRDRYLLVLRVNGE